VIIRATSDSATCEVTRAFRQHEQMLDALRQREPFLLRETLEKPPQL
jgi:hypothetical protein